MIRMQSAATLAKCFSLNGSVTDLNLQNNALGPAAGCLLGSVLATNSTLTRINLAHNNIDATACLTICQGCVHNNSVSSLTLDGNPIGYTGGMYIFYSLNIAQIVFLIKYKVAAVMHTAFFRKNGQYLVRHVPCQSHINLNYYPSGHFLS